MSKRTDFEEDSSDYIEPTTTSNEPTDDLEPSTASAVTDQHMEEYISDLLTIMAVFSTLIKHFISSDQDTNKLITDSIRGIKEKLRALDQELNKKKDITKEIWRVITQKPDMSHLLPIAKTHLNILEYQIKLYNNHCKILILCHELTLAIRNKTQKQALLNNCNAEIRSIRKDKTKIEIKKTLKDEQNSLKTQVSLQDQDIAKKYTSLTSLCENVNAIETELKSEKQKLLGCPQDLFGIIDMMEQAHEKSEAECEENTETLERLLVEQDVRQSEDELYDTSLNPMLPDHTNINPILPETHPVDLQLPMDDNFLETVLRLLSRDNY